MRKSKYLKRWVTRAAGVFIHYSFFISPAGAQGRYSAAFTLSATDFADTISIEWTGGQVVVPATVGGRPCRFLLDTGASLPVVYDGTELARLCTPAGTILSRDAAGNTDSVPLVTLPPLRLGGVTLTGCQATVQRAPADDPDGILGFSLVSGGLAMKIDVPRRRLVLTDRRPCFCREDGAVSLRYHLDYHVPYVDIRPFSRWRCRVLFDTGSRQFLMLNRQQLDRAMQRRKAPAGVTVEARIQGRHAIGHHGTEPWGDVVFMQLDALRLSAAGPLFTQVHTLTTQGGSHLGAALLSWGAVAFCPRHHRLLFWPDAPADTIAVGNPRLEVAFVPSDDGRPQVGLVLPGSEPWRQGLRTGDIIELIDHRPVGTLARFARWPFQPGRAHTFTLIDAQGRRRDVSWVRLQ